MYTKSVALLKVLFNRTWFEETIQTGCLKKNELSSTQFHVKLFISNFMALNGTALTLRWFHFKSTLGKVKNWKTP